MQILRATACALFVISLATSSLLANPSTKEPESLLRIRPADPLPGDAVKPDYEAINQRYQKAKAANDELWQKHQQKKLVLGDARKFAPVYLLQAQLGREATMLKLRAEASGWDLATRVQELDLRLTAMVKEMIQLPNFPFAPLQEQVKRESAAGVKRLPAIEGLIKRKQYVQAEGELFEIVDAISKNAIWFPTADFSLYYTPFRPPLETATQARREASLAELKPIIDQGPDFAKLQEELTAAAASMGTSGQAAFDSQMLSGPEWLAAWHDRWPKLQAASQRAVMAQIACEHIDTQAPPQSPTLLTKRHEFAVKLPQALAALIAADAQRTSGPEAASLYQRYVAVAANLAASGPRAEVQAALEPALQSLATKGGLDAELTAYRSATAPLLAWQRFMARSRAKMLGQAATSAQDWAQQRLSTRSQPFTLIPEPQGTIAQVKVINTADQVLPGVFAKEPSGTVILSDLVPVNAAKSRWVARFKNRVLGLVAAPPAESWQAETSRLELALLATPQAGPLSLDAAAALAGARLGVCETVGGAIDQLTLEPLLTRFITLPNEAASLLPLGPLEPDPVNNDSHGDSLSVRCDMLKPTWYQHECFVLVP
ncbi:hypothetical protein NA78x_004830 [Anatilimnocola sp. NA78]|uniref:hypothetical protein n=1 Tax=Anatilimnocola sp. NA78 TaxID=3415683 RepID=UPI003CE4F119